MKQFLKGLGLTAVILSITTFGSLAHAIPITAGYLNAFDEHEDAPNDPALNKGDFEQFGSASFYLNGGSEETIYVFRGSLNPQLDHNDQFKIQLDEGQTMRRASIVFASNLSITDPILTDLTWTWAFKNNSTGRTLFSIDNLESPQGLAISTSFDAGSYLVTIGLPESSDISEKFVDYTMAFTVETAQISVVPLPAALPLYGAGMALIGFIGWKRKRKQA